MGRAAATLAAMAVGRERVLARARRGAGTAWQSRIGRYLEHDRLGAELLASAGSDPLTVAWAREHHQAPASWSLPRGVAAALKAADGD